MTRSDVAIQRIHDMAAQPAKPAPDDQTSVIVLTEKELRAILAECERAARIEGQADGRYGVIPMNTCDDCGGAGGYVDSEQWVDCPSCSGSGWVEEEAPPDLGIDDLDERAGGAPSP
jgi:hypothetical protein